MVDSCRRRRRGAAPNPCPEETSTAPSPPPRCCRTQRRILQRTLARTRCSRSRNSWLPRWSNFPPSTTPTRGTTRTLRRRSQPGGRSPPPSSSQASSHIAELNPAPANTQPPSRLQSSNARVAGSLCATRSSARSRGRGPTAPTAANANHGASRNRWNSFCHTSQFASE